MEKEIKKKPQKYNFGYYFTFYKMVVNKFKRKHKPIINNRALQELGESCLIFCNHGSVFDFIIAGAVILPKKAVFVTTRRTMFKRPFNWVVNKAPHILRDQFSADVKSIMEMREAIKQGLNVVLYPEGKVSTCGVTNHIPKATGKLVKLFNVPVVTIMSKGNWATKPSWAKRLRTGRIEINTELILNKEQIKQMSAEQIEELIRTKMQYNENLYQIENNYEFKGRQFAKGLDKVLYKCPICGAEFDMSTKGNDIFCNVCGFKARYNFNGLITSENKDFTLNRIDLWYDYEKQCLKEELSNENFSIEGNVVALMANQKKVKYDLVAEGKLFLDKEKVTFIANNDELIKLQYHIDKVEGIPFTVGTQIYLIIDGMNYEFDFTDKLMSTKFNMAVELIAEERNANKEKR